MGANDSESDPWGVRQKMKEGLTADYSDNFQEDKTSSRRAGGMGGGVGGEPQRDIASMNNSKAPRSRILQGLKQDAVSRDVREGR